jgi:hypothetical protein
MIIFAHNQNMLALHFLQIDTADNDNKGLNWFDHAFHGKHALGIRSVLTCRAGSMPRGIDRAPDLEQQSEFSVFWWTR